MAMPTPSAAPRAPGPVIEPMKMAMRIPGKASNVSMERSAMDRGRDGKTDAPMPAGMPMSAPRPAAASASPMDSRVATRMRKKMSRPRESVPAQCSGDGCWFRCVRFTTVASSPQIGGATTAIIRMAMTAISPSTPLGALRNALSIDSRVPSHRSRVDHRQHRVDRRVDENDHHPEHQDDTLHDGIVACLHRGHERGAKALPREHVLDDDRATDDASKEDAAN